MPTRVLTCLPRCHDRPLAWRGSPMTRFGEAPSTILVRVRHPDYLDAEAWVALDAGRQAVTLTLTPRPPPS